MAEKKVVVLAMDGSKGAFDALDFYMKNVHQCTDEVVAIHCVHHRAPFTMGTPWMPLDTKAIDNAVKEENEKGKEICRKIQKHLESFKDAGHFKVMKVDGGDPAETILSKAQEVGASVIVVGCRGLGKIRRTILGSVSSYILHHSHVPVLVCQ